MRYAILIYGDESAGDTTPEGVRTMVDEYRSYGRWLAERGIEHEGEALRPTDRATTITLRAGRVTVLDGPFAETEAQLGGFYLIDCQHLDDALEAARACPGARSGSVEVRPVVELDAHEGEP